MSLTNSILIAGGGIGGLASAIALARSGVPVTVIERAHEFGEIGAGVQVGPNGFAALDALGLGEAVRKACDQVESLIAEDGYSGEAIYRVPTSAFEDRFHRPYGVIHRADLLNVLVQAARENPLVKLVNGLTVTAVEQNEMGVTALTESDERFMGSSLIACDGIRSAVFRQYVGDPLRASGHVVYRSLVDAEAMPNEGRRNAIVTWMAPNCSLVCYPVRQHRQFNLVASFLSREKEVWGVRSGDHEEVMRYFAHTTTAVRSVINSAPVWRRFATADRQPFTTWVFGRVALLGDAAHPMLQYLAQGAMMAIEDAATLGAVVGQSGKSIEKALLAYQHARVGRTTRVQLESRAMGDTLHSDGAERTQRNTRWKDVPPKHYCQSFDWLYKRHF